MCHLSWFHEDISSQDSVQEDLPEGDLLQDLEDREGLHQDIESLLTGDRGHGLLGDEGDLHLDLHDKLQLLTHQFI